MLTANWTGVSGNWTNPAIWSTNPNYPNNDNPPGATYVAVINGPMANTINLDAPITVQGLTFPSGTIVGPNDLTVSGPATWSGGNFRSAAGGSSTVSFKGGATLSGGRSDGVPVILGGTNSWTGTVFMSAATVGVAVQLINDTLSTLTLNGATFTSISLGFGQFVNRGTLRVTGGTNTLDTTISSGSIDVQAGTLVLQAPNGPNAGNHSFSGPVTLAAGTTLRLSTAANAAGLTVTNTGSITGAGAVTVGLSNFTVNGNYNVSGLTMVGLGSISGTAIFNTAATCGSIFAIGTIAGSGPINDNGSFGTAGDLSITGSGPLNVLGSMNFSGTLGPLTITGRSLNLLGPTNSFGSITASPPVVRLGGGGELSIGPSATLDTTVSTTFQSTGTGSAIITNAGTLRRVGNSGPLVIGAGVVLNNSGLLDLQAGALSVSGTLKGTGTVSGPVTVASGGVIAPGASPGVLHMTGPVTMSPGAIFQAELGGPIPNLQYDQLDLTGGGSIALNGSSLQTLLSYAPTPADALTVVFGGPVTGTFGGQPNGAEVFVGNIGGANFVATINYTPSSVILSNIHAVPEPAAWLLTGTAVAVWALRRTRRKVSFPRA